MNVPTALFALLLLPLALGTALVLATAWPRHAADWARALGTGWLLGALIAALATHLPAGAAPAAIFAATVPWLLALLLFAIAAAWWRRARQRRAVPGPGDGHGAAATGTGLPTGRALPLPDLVWIALLALVLLHLALAAWQAMLLPTVPWDAWTTWLGRAKAWWGSEALLPMLSPAQWLVADDPALRATLAPHYPETLPRLLLWIASAAGDWRPAWLHLPWPLLGAALACGLYGQLRAAGTTPRMAMAGSYACVSLPLLNAHLTLAGYADLWVAAVLAFAVLHAYRGWLLRARGELVLAGALALMLPLVKLEGAVWLVCLLAAACWMALPRRWRLALPLAAVLLCALVLPFAALPLPVPGLGVVRLSWGEVAIPAMGTLQLHWRPVSAQVLASLFVFGNWHLLWYLLPAVVALRWRRLRAHAALSAIGVFLLLAHAFLFVLFFFTDASAWAENLTSINRLLLQVAPVTIAWLVLLWVAPAAEATGQQGQGAAGAPAATP